MDEGYDNVVVLNKEKKIKLKLFYLNENVFLWEVIYFCNMVCVV